MSALNEEKNVESLGTFITNYTSKRTEADLKQSSFLGEHLKSSEIQKFPNTLKAEIILIRNSFGTKEALTTKQIWKNNKFECKDIFLNDEYVAGMTEDLLYINKTVSGSNKVYLYDQVSDVCFKIEPTSLAGTIVHSLEYAKFIIDGVNSTGIGIMETETNIKSALDGTKCYEPDLSNFSSKTEMIFYSADLSKQQTMNIKEFLQKGKPSTMDVGGETYTFANYVSTSSGGTRVWANVRTNANGLEANWVWIPRYAYKLDQDNKKSDIIFVDINDKPCDGSNLPNDYVVHEAFKQKDGLKGIWMSKYQPSPVETVAVDSTEPESPDLSNFSAENTKLIYYTEDGKSSTEDAFSSTPAQSITKENKTYYFYNYTKKIWANVKTIANGLEANWVWIPRYAYKLESGESSVILVDSNDRPIDKTKYGSTLPKGYTVHEAFKQNSSLKGLWMSKYQPTATETGAVDASEGQAPDLSNFDSATTKLIYYTEDGKSSTEEAFSSNPAQTITKNNKTYYFYNYTKKIWPNVKTTANELEANWVWIPRYAYKIESGTAKVVLVDENNSPLDTEAYPNGLPAGYTLHEAFTQGDGLKGIWMSKYQPSKKTN